MNRYFRFFILFIIFIDCSDNSGQNTPDSLFAKGKYKEAAVMLENELKNSEPEIGRLYFAAQAWALSGDIDSAMSKLQQCFKKGFIDLQGIEQDNCFKKIRESEKWEEFMNLNYEHINKLKNSFPEKHTVIDSIMLPQPLHDGKMSVEKAMNNRRSERQFKDSPLSLAEVSQMLWAAYGVTEKMDKPTFLRGGLKTAPSAGALYPLELYLVAGKVDGLEAGVYWYKSEEHKLLKISAQDVRKSLCDAAYGQEMIEEAPASIVYSAVFERMTSKYGARGRERYVCMDLGHSAQNVYLQAESLGLGTCAIGAFEDLEKMTCGFCLPYPELLTLKKMSYL
ncbi:MAG: SagB/ThcOx family dehydrogenase [Bacteroidia bacterium]|nr:SagB/ThcOx family dehydrogenase [Bacteroidia bacterium]